jgi:hypothetical protein
MKRIYALFIMVAVGIWSHAETFVPFVIPAKANPESEIKLDYKPITEQDRIYIRDGHFYRGSEPIRFWGVNLSFASNFPTHADAELVAERMARAGINAIRCHHMDSATWPRGIWQKDGKTLHPEALDRLDYFIDQLAKRGIYTDLNLHVGKEYSRSLGLPPSPDGMDKMIAIFVPELVAAQKDYAKRMLDRKNAYRPYRYADDPAIAIVEITNENSLFMWSAAEVLPNLPTVYADILQNQYNSWLKSKYGTNAKLIEAWAASSKPLSDNLLTNGDFGQWQADRNAPDGWTLEQHETAKVRASVVGYHGKSGLLIEPTTCDGTEWHLQFNQSKLKLQEGQDYTLVFEIAAPKERTLSVSVIQAHDPWNNLGLYRAITLRPEWKLYRLTFTATQSDDNARTGFSFGKQSEPFYVRAIGFHEGADFTPDKTESLENATVKVFGEVESRTRQLDRMMFFAETEKAYFDGMRQYIKTDLGSKAMVTGTIVFGPLGLYAQSDMDFIDSHAYWQHPRFPNRPWDSSDWLIDQKAMSEYPQEATLFRLASERLAGKPFTVTEYNHPAPLDSQAECVPMIASFAAAQNWDGVWLYTYSHTGDTWGREVMNSYFDIDTNPAKWGFVPAGALIFRERLLLPQNFKMTLALTGPQGPALNQLAGLHSKYNSNLFGATGLSCKDIVRNEIAWVMGQSEKTITQKQRPTQGDLQRVTSWDWEPGRYFIKNEFCLISAGHRDKPAAFEWIKTTSPERSTITVTALDGKEMHVSSSRLLITACGRCENTGMEFSEDRRTVGLQWGKAPVQIEAVEGTLDLSKFFQGPYNKDAVWTCCALNPDGTKKAEVPIKDNILELSAKYGTMWYVLTK